MKRKISIFILISLLFVGGGYFALEAFRIEIKAKISQLLLKQSWKNTLKSGNFQQPWYSFDGNAILLLQVPKHKITQVVLKGTSGQALAFGPAFHNESFLPFENGTTVISTHRDSHGLFIKKLIKGDLIKLQDQYKKWHTYSVDDFFILDLKKDTIALSENDNRLMIITCYPFNTLSTGTPYRYVVSAKNIKFNL